MGWKDTIKDDTTPKKSWRDTIEDEPAEESLLDQATGFAKGVGRAAVEDLPSYGAMAGGLLGAAGGPVTALGGAAAGGALAKTIQLPLKQAIYGEAPTYGELATSPIKGAAEGLLTEAGGQIGGKLVGKAAEKGLQFAGEMASVPKKAISTFMKRANQVEKLQKASGGDLQVAADQVRNQLSEQIKQFKNAQNAKINSALSVSDKTADMSGVISQLERVAERADTATHPEVISEVNRLIQNIGKVAEESGGIEHIPLERVNNIKNMLQEATDYSFKDSPLVRNNKANTGVAAAARVANSELRRAAPEIGKANDELSKLHKITKKINKRIVTEGEAPNSLIVAGSQPGSKPASDLGKLEEAVGSEFLAPAEDLAAMRYLGDPGLLPDVGTGRALAPLVLGGAAGAGSAWNDISRGDIAGAGAKVGSGLLAGSLGSPYMLKKALQSRLLQKGLAPDVSKIPMRYLSDKVAKGLLGD